MRKMTLRRRRQRGANLIEFTLIGIPIIFLLISVFEVSRGMWLYQMAAHAAKETARYIIVHGSNCDGEACGRTVGEIATQMYQNFSAVDPDEVRVTFRTGCQVDRPFRDVSTCSALNEDTLTAYMNNGTTWPGLRGNNFSGDFVEVEMHFPFRSAIAMFWPGAGRGQNFGTVEMYAASRELVQF